MGQVGREVRIPVHSPEAYELELWRYGWKKELVRKLGWYDEHGPRATVQITPDGDYSRTGVEWNKFGYANPALKQYVTAPERSGFVLLHARTKSGLFFSFPWVVAPASPAQAGRAGFEHHLERVQRVRRPQQLHQHRQAARRADRQFPAGARPVHRRGIRQLRVEEYAPLSFERPELINFVPENEQVTNPIEGRTACHLAPAEWRLLGWLEREGFDYDFYAETQFHFGQLNLDDYQVLIISTHPEYWSRDMYDRLKSWVHERGGKLLYLGGNGLNCEVEFLDDATIIVQNGNERERVRQGTTESRFHPRVESEANLLGVVFTYDGIMTSAPYGSKTPGTGCSPERVSKTAPCSASRACTAACPAAHRGTRPTKFRPIRPRTSSCWRRGTQSRQRWGRHDRLRNAQRRPGVLGRIDHLAQLDSRR